jgi:hypothetical protein
VVFLSKVQVRGASQCPIRLMTKDHINAEGIDDQQAERAANREPGMKKGKHPLHPSIEPHLSTGQGSEAMSLWPMLIQSLHSLRLFLLQDIIDLQTRPRHSALDLNST